MTKYKTFEEFKGEMPSIKIREIWDEMKELKRLNETGEKFKNYNNLTRKNELELKFEEIETLFGHESTLLKAMIYFLDKNK